EEEAGQDNDHGHGDLVRQQDEDNHDHGRDLPGDGPGDGMIRVGPRVCYGVEQVQEDEKPDICHDPRHHVRPVKYDVGVHRVEENGQKGDLLVTEYAVDQIVQEQDR